VGYPAIARIESSSGVPLAGRGRDFDWALSHPAGGWMFAWKHHGLWLMAVSMVGGAIGFHRKDDVAMMWMLIWRWTASSGPHTNPRKKRRSRAAQVWFALTMPSFLSRGTRLPAPS